MLALVDLAFTGDSSEDASIVGLRTGARTALRPHPRQATGCSGSKEPLRGQREQSLAGPGRRVADPPLNPATVERQVPRHSGQPREELANGWYGRPPPFDSEI